jgi:hypothetical protein
MNVIGVSSVRVASSMRRGCGRSVVLCFVCGFCCCCFVGVSADRLCRLVGCRSGSLRALMWRVCYGEEGDKKKRALEQSINGGDRTLDLKRVKLAS